MKKLTRYTTFESLKSNTKSSDTFSPLINKNFAEFEEFLKVMRNKMALAGVTGSNKVSREQQSGK